MFQHEESDEDDYEGYFLQPVNGYNIADRIKSANKELFESTSVQSGDFTEIQRKVSFRSEPDYEPEPDTEPELDNASSCDDDDIAAINQVLDRRDDIVVIEEQEVMKMNKEEGDRCTPDQISNNGVDNEVDDICEEIIDFTVCDEVATAENGQQPDDEPLITEETKRTESNDISNNIRPKVMKDSKTGKPRGQQPKPSSAKVRRTESNQHHHQHNHRPNSSVTKQSSESFLKIQLNFKPCCEYKYLENDRLPRYCGYISQYGLSKEQLERREKRRERLRNRQSDKTAKQLQEETMKSEVNEEAFARWLQNKMRSSRSMTKNMYDYRPTKQATTKGKKKV